MRGGPGRTLGFLIGLVAAGVALRLASTGELTTPPLGSLGELAAWVDQREPVATALALVRLLAEIGVWYVAALSALHAASSVLRLADGHRIADALTLPGLGRLVRAGLGISLAAASSVGGPDEVSAGDAITITASAESPLVIQQRSEVPGTASMRPRLPTTGEPGTATMAPAPRTWVVDAGESFWSIAEELLADAWRRRPTEAEIDPFWRTFVERNRGRLADPGDPDLIHPGQVFEIPAVPSPPA